MFNKELFSILVHGEFCALPSKKQMAARKDEQYRGLFITVVSKALTLEAQGRHLHPLPSPCLS